MITAGLNLIKDFEGCSLTKYKCAAGVETIGYGHTGDVPDEITQETADIYLAEDLQHSEDTVGKYIASVLKPYEHAALASLIFNIGSGNFASSTLLKKLLANDFEAAADEFPRWRKASGKVLPGLEERRAAERWLFKTGEYHGRDSGEYRPKGKYWQGV